jgi:diguanylate cyclase (GGDEF)-like protein/PAS domain S-box-containing protein
MRMQRSKIALASEQEDNGYLSQMGLADVSLSGSTCWISDAIRSIAALWALVILLKFCLIAVTVSLTSLIAAPAKHDAPMLIGILVTDVLICLLPRTPLMTRLLPHIQMQIMMVLAALAGFGSTYWFAELPSASMSGMVSPALCFMSVAILAVCIFGGRHVLSLSYSLGSGLAMLTIYGAGSFAAVAIFLLALMTAALMQARRDHMRRLQDHKANIRGTRSEQLLIEYEQSGRGWFWETDRNGHITYLSDTLAQSLKVDMSELLGRAFTDLIAAGDKMAGDGDRTLGFHLSARTSFADIAVRVALAKDERWWAVSGRPVSNEYGQFMGFRGSGSDLTEMRRSQAEVNRLAQYDSLTGLANRVQMLRTLEQTVVDNMGRPGDCALFLLDLDRFKSVNDTMGHPAGDALLRQVSQRLQQVVGSRGMVGRLGGDEFKVVLPSIVDRNKLGVLADAIIASLSEPYDIEGSKVIIGVSIGIAMCPEHGVTADALIRNADLSLYAAKGAGRGVYRFYSNDMHSDAEDRRQLEQDLRVALSVDGLSLVYQPVVTVESEKVTGFEALLRWDHPKRGPISPAVFIPIAEDAGLITQIGEWVLRTACQDASYWPAGVRVAVNVSPIQFANPSLPGVVMSALAHAHLAPERLELEITESVFLNDDDSTDAMFARLKSIGVRLALDDFGTGYSSLGYLKKAPFDKIKIDQSFVRGAAEPASRNSAIIKSIVSLAEALGMDTTAEGVETHDELELIRSLGCSHVQGYIYGKGINAQEALARFANVGISARPSGFKSARPARKAMLRSITVRHGEHSYPARIRNISEQGALVEGLWNVPKDTPFILELADGLQVKATARWSADDRMGVQFDRAIDLAKLNTNPAQTRLAG